MIGGHGISVSLLLLGVFLQKPLQSFLTQIRVLHEQFLQEVAFGFERAIDLDQDFKFDQFEFFFLVLFDFGWLY